MKELEQVAADFGDSRRSELGSAEEIVEYDPQAYIVRENTNVVVTKDGNLNLTSKVTKDPDEIEALMAIRK